MASVRRKIVGVLAGKRVLFSLVAAFLALALAATGCNVGKGQGAPASNSAGDRPQEIRLAVTDLVGMEELQRDFGAFRDALADVLDVEVKLFPVTDRVAAVTALDMDQVDLVLTGPAEYVVLRAKTEAIPVIGITRPDYHSIIAVLANSPVRSLADLKGKKIAMSDVGSTSGHLGPSKMLVDAGVDPLKDMEVLMLGDNDLQALYGGHVDAWGGNPIDLERFVEAKKISMDEFRIVAEGPALPNDVLVAHPKLPSSFIEDIRTRMVENQETLIASMLTADANRKYRGSTLVPANDADYQYMREAYRAIGVNDFTKFVGD